VRPGGVVVSAVTTEPPVASGCTPRRCAPVGANLVIHGADLRHQGRQAFGVIAGCGNATAVSGLPAAHGLARIAGPQLPIEERGDPGTSP
jgi:hypothetical protein